MFTTTKNAETSFLRPCVRFWYWSVSFNVLDNWKSWIIIWDYGYKCTKNYQMVIFIFWLMKRLYRSFTKFWVKFDIKVALNFRLLFIIWYRKHFRVNFTKLLCNCQLVISHQLELSTHTHTNNMDDSIIKQGILLRLRITIDSKIFYAY